MVRFGRKRRFSVITRIIRTGRGLKIAKIRNR